MAFGSAPPTLVATVAQPHRPVLSRVHGLARTPCTVLNASTPERVIAIEGQRVASLSPGG